MGPQGPAGPPGSQGEPGGVLAQAGFECVIGQFIRTVTPNAPPQSTSNPFMFISTGVFSGSGISTVGQQFDSIVLQPGIYRIHFANLGTMPIDATYQEAYVSLNGTVVTALGSGGDVLVQVSQVNSVFQLAALYTNPGGFTELNCQLTITRTQ